MWSFFLCSKDLCRLFLHIYYFCEAGGIDFGFYNNLFKSTYKLGVLPVLHFEHMTFYIFLNYESYLFAAVATAKYDKYIFSLHAFKNKVNQKV